MKVRMVVEVEIADRSDEHVTAFLAGGLGHDFIKGGPLVVTALGTEDCGIVSAKVIELEPLENDKT